MRRPNNSRRDAPLASFEEPPTYKPTVNKKRHGPRTHVRTDGCDRHHLPGARQQKQAVENQRNIRVAFMHGEDCDGHPRHDRPRDREDPIRRGELISTRRKNRNRQTCFKRASLAHPASPAPPRARLRSSDPRCWHRRSTPSVFSLASSVCRPLVDVFPALVDAWRRCCGSWRCDVPCNGMWGTFVQIGQQPSRIPHSSAENRPSHCRIPQIIWMPFSARRMRIGGANLGPTPFFSRQLRDIFVGRPR